MAYEYGSSPVNGYGYMDFVKHIAPVLPMDDRVFFHHDSLQWRNNHNGIPLELFRNICHWKSPRRFGKVCNNEINNVNRLWENALQQLGNPPFQSEAIENALMELTELNGVGVPMASALLTAWNPDQFGMIDFKVLAVLNLQNINVAGYITYRNRLLELKDTQPELNDCALRQIELALWHWYPIQNAGIKERPDN